MFQGRMRLADVIYLCLIQLNNVHDLNENKKHLLN